MSNQPNVVKKPWGHEEWLCLNERYCYKRIYINAGQRTSLQYHEKKLETTYIIKGKARVFLEDTWRDVEEGDFFTVMPGTVHRIEAVTDLITQEVSTPEVDDVIRVQDDAERPSGRIDREHASN